MPDSSMQVIAAESSKDYGTPLKYCFFALLIKIYASERCNSFFTPRRFIFLYLDNTLPSQLCGNFAFVCWYVLVCAAKLMPIKLYRSIATPKDYYVSQSETIWSKALEPLSLGSFLALKGSKKT